YNGEYFQQHEGTAMGNSLSPFIANLFMSQFETEIKDKFEYFIRVCGRHLRVIRNSENKLKFDEYRKETATLRYIPNYSHHPFQHKMASFNFLIHRLLNFALSKEMFEHEKQLIKNIAKSNDANLVGETRVEKSVVVRCFVGNVQFFVSTPKVPVPTPGSTGQILTDMRRPADIYNYYPNRRQHNHKLFRNLYNRFGETGSFPQKVTMVLQKLSHSYCLKIYQLAYNLLNFYKICKPKTQMFLIRFYLPIRRYLLDGVLNNNLWASENPHVIKEIHFLHEFKVNVWYGGISNFVIEPYELPFNLTGPLYLNFPQHNLNELLKEKTLRKKHMVYARRSTTTFSLSLKKRSLEPKHIHNAKILLKSTCPTVKCKAAVKYATA
ncbi:hypothetical protein NQ318_014920, partial [Aromia moschata]